MERGKFFKESVVSEPRRGWHNLSFDNSFTANAGKLYPTKCLEVFPGDVIHDKSSGFSRLMPLVAPVMGKLNQFSYHFIVRNRDIWTQWDKFITNYDQKKTWQQNTSFVPPAMPYIDVKEIFWSQPMYHTGSGLTTGDYSRVMYICQASLNGQHNSFLTLSPTEASTFLGSAYGDKKCWIVVPNKEDGLPYYNPFSIGSLLEFLGINIDGFYKEVNNAWFFALQTSHTQQNNALDPWDYKDVGAEGNLGTAGPDFFITREWWDSHMILGYIYCGDGSLSGATHFMGADGSFSDAGTPTMVNSNGFFPFDNNNSDKYDFQISDLPLRAYRFIYDEYFRDENYMEVNPNTDFSRDGDDLDWNNVPATTIWEYLTFAVKCYEHDLYTSALPSAQRGNPVRFLPDSQVEVTAESSSSANGVNKYNMMLGVDGNVYEKTFDASSSAAYKVSLVADMSAATIENLRFYNSMQRYLERKARTGGRYYEYMIGQWGYHIEDAKLNRPIYLGGDRTPIQISEVTQTSASDLQTGQPLGDLAGRGVAISEDNYIEFTSPDYGFLIELCSIVPRTSYGQGIKPMFKRFNYMDYPLPDFANLGEEPIKKRELYATLSKATDESTFGYQCRYYQFKYERDQIHGDMLSSLRHWNFGRILDGVPFNGWSFLDVNPSYRQFAVTDPSYDHFICTMWHDIQINRALPELSIPSL